MIRKRAERTDKDIYPTNPTKDNALYCKRDKFYIHLCRCDDCEYWQDCVKALVDIGYELVPDRRKNSPTRIMWKLNK